MPRFFSEEIEGDRVFLRGEDARHIQKSLRMQLGDPLTVCDLGGTDLSCRIEEFSPDLVTAAILERRPSEAEPTVQVRLYQALPKGDKLDLIVQKAVELGVHEIIPVLTSRCISRPDGKSMEKKIQRLSRIALEAAKQCGRGIVPKVGALRSWEAALSEMGEAPLAFMRKPPLPCGRCCRGRRSRFPSSSGRKGAFPGRRWRRPKPRACWPPVWASGFSGVRPRLWPPFRC